MHVQYYIALFNPFIFATSSRQLDVLITQMERMSQRKDDDNVKAKFHYTDPTGPARTQRSFAAKKSVRVRAGRRQSPCGSGRVRVMEFSFNVIVVFSL